MTGNVKCTSPGKCRISLRYTTSFTVYITILYQCVCSSSYKYFNEVVHIQKVNSCHQYGQCHPKAWLDVVYTVGTVCTSTSDRRKNYSKLYKKRKKWYTIPGTKQIILTDNRVTHQPKKQQPPNKPKRYLEEMQKTIISNTKLQNCGDHKVFIEATRRKQYCISSMSAFHRACETVLPQEDTWISV